MAHQGIRRLAANGAVWPDLVVVSTPSLQFLPRIAKAHEPVRVQAFRPEAAVDALDIGVVRPLPRPGEVHRHIMRIGAEIEGARTICERQCGPFRSERANFPESAVGAGSTTVAQFTFAGHTGDIGFDNRAVVSKRLQDKEFLL